MQNKSFDLFSLNFYPSIITKIKLLKYFTYLLVGKFVLRRISTRSIKMKKTWWIKIINLNRATSKTWTRILDPGPGLWKPEPWKTWTLKNLDLEKPGPWRTWTLKNLDPEKPRPWKTWETAGYGKMIKRPHIITY